MRGDEHRTTTYVDLPYEIRNAILMAAVDPELLPLAVACSDSNVRVRRHENYTHLDDALKTFAALSQIPSLYRCDGLAHVARTHVHRVAKYFAQWRYRRQHLVQIMGEPGISDIPPQEFRRAQHALYFLRCTTFACGIAKILRSSNPVALDQMIAEVMRWEIGSIEADGHDPDDFFEDLTRSYERMSERNETTVSQPAVDYP